MACCCSGSEKTYKKIPFAILCITLGWFGIHRYQVGKNYTGVLYNFTLGLLGIGVIVDFILILCGKFKTRCGEYIK